MKPRRHASYERFAQGSLVMNRPATRVLACIALALLLTVGQAAAVTATGAAPTPPAAPPAKEAPPEPDEDHEPERFQDNPLRPQGPAIDMPQEIVDMLKQRQLVIERREEALKVEETRLSALKRILRIFSLDNNNSRKMRRPPLQKTVSLSRVMRRRPRWIRWSRCTKPCLRKRRRLASRSCRPRWPCRCFGL